MIKRSTLAVAIAIAAPLAIATAQETVAAPVSVLKAPPAFAVTDVQYIYDYGAYAYRPVYQYNGYTYWYPVWSYPGYYTYWYR